MKKNNLIIFSALLTVLTADVAYGTLPKYREINNTNSVISQGLNSEEIKQKAEAITVKIESNHNAGSGVIIGKEGNTYTVLTNAHVINSKIPNQVITIDGKIHESKIIKQGDSLEGNDLGILTFNSPHNYQVATLAINYDIRDNQRVYSVGFPEETNQFYFTQGTIKLQAPKPFLGGYQIGYDIDVKPGMSGGALLNENGELIGVNGLLKEPILNEAYNYLDGSQPFEENIATYRQLSFAVPIQTLVEVAPNLALIPEQWRRGLNLAANVEQIAKKITVRFDHKDQVMGSGVIVGKNEDTYYILTACHVISDAYCQSGKVKDDYTLVTPDGERYTVDSNDVILPEGLDAAIIKINSKKAYQVATLGRYEIPRLEKQLVFVSGFPGELNGVRKFTAGYRFQRDRGLSLAFNTDSQSLKANVDISGYELRYTNLSQPGMSGGPVLDIKGQVIGINTGQEGEQISSTEVRQLGYAFGVPVSTLLGFANQKKVNLNHFTIVDQMPELLKDQDLKTVQQHSAFIVEKPPENSSKNTWLNYGNELWRIERYQEAIAAFKKAIELDPKFAEAYYALGLVYADQATKTNNDSLEREAIAAFEQAISLSQNWILTGQTWYRKSLSFSKLEKYEEALGAIEQAIKLIDDDAKFYSERGWILQELNRYTQAKEALSQSLEISPLGTTYMRRCILLMLDLHELEAARQDCTKAIDNGVIEGHAIRALVHLALGDEQQALADHNQAIALAPKISTFYSLRAQTYESRGNPEQAIADWTKAIELNPNNADFYSSRGFLYHKMTNYQQAIADFTKAIVLEPKDDTNYVYRGFSYRLNGQYDLAIKDLTKAIEIKPDQGDYYRQRADHKFLAGDPQGALEDYNQVIKLDPDNAQAYQHRGNLYQIQFNDYDKAMADYDRALAINPQYGIAYEARGNLRKLLSDLAGALEDYNQAIALIDEADPTTPWLWKGTPREVWGNFLPHQLKTVTINYDSVYRSRGDLRLQLKDYPGALSDYNEAIRLNPNDGDNYTRRGDYYSQTNQPEKAKADYNQAIEVYGNTIKTDPQNTLNFGIYASRGQLYRKLKNYEAAIAAYTKAIELAPYHQDIYYVVRGHVYREIKEYQLALQDYSQAIEIDQKDPNAYLSRAGVYGSLGNHEAAIKDYSKVIELNEIIDHPVYYIAYLSRGELHQKLFNYSEAIDDFSHFIERQPENYQGYLSRCGVYKQLGEYNQAINDCNQAVTLNPNYPLVYIFRSEIYVKLKNYTAAMEDANKIVELVPSLPFGMFLRGFIYHSQNDYPAALTEYELALSKDENFFLTITNIGLIKYEQGDIEKAVELWQQAINLNKNFLPAKLALAVGLYHQGKQEKAFSLSKEALSIDKNLADLDYLKDESLWAKQLSKDTEKLLQTPEIKRFLAQ
ncbi:tetratricopeptide repeat protein [Crocosphaera sp.]|uniref:serine protease n=1 Tax=Crocosphaera sp. TaxID=2729996 RepID=UPI003F1EF773|nr:tetratricopeptide repeat protein [Crocosphaera sp.]